VPLDALLDVGIVGHDVAFVPRLVDATRHTAGYGKSSLCARIDTARCSIQRRASIQRRGSPFRVATPLALGGTRAHGKPGCADANQRTEGGHLPPIALAKWKSIGRIGRRRTASVNHPRGCP
jgi:hypothetical protein